jgi:hypothetical protein
MLLPAWFNEQTEVVEGADNGENLHERTPFGVMFDYILPDWVLSLHAYVELTLNNVISGYCPLETSKEQSENTYAEDCGAPTQSTVGLKYHL